MAWRRAGLDTEAWPAASVPARCYAMAAARDAAEMNKRASACMHKGALRQISIEWLDVDPVRDSSPGRFSQTGAAVVMRRALAPGRSPSSPSAVVLRRPLGRGNSLFRQTAEQHASAQPQAAEEQDWEADDEPLDFDTEAGPTRNQPVVVFLLDERRGQRTWRPRGQARWPRR